MSAQAADVVDFPSTRAPQAQPVHKLNVFELVRRLILEDQNIDHDERDRLKDAAKKAKKPEPTFLASVALNLVQYLAEATDKETGVAIVEIATIAERIGRSPATVKRQLRRLIEVGVIERRFRQRGKHCYASQYRLLNSGATKGAATAPFQSQKGANGDTPRFTDDRTPGHQCTTYARAFIEKPFPNVLIPGSEGIRANGDAAPSTVRVVEPPRTARQGEKAAQSAPRSDTELEYFNFRDLEDWYSRKGYFDYERGSPSAKDVAVNCIECWRERHGDFLVIKAFNWVKSRRGGAGLYDSPEDRVLTKQLVKRLGKI